jgi:glycosyltransferase involved in cell wall biosynthesis
MNEEGGNTEHISSDSAKLLILIPAHNEAEHLQICLESFVNQTRIPDALVLIDDNSTDTTPAIAIEFEQKYPWIKYIRKDYGSGHLPGSKVIEAFYFGMRAVSFSFDFIGKFDADIVLPPNYFERMLQKFGANPKLGMCSGLLYIKQNDKWIYEPIAAKNHIRGPIKLYTKACFEAIKGLQPAIGWDTADVLLARYNRFEVDTVCDLQVKHLRPTGQAYSVINALKQGETLYTLRYGLILGLLASLKMALSRKSLLLPLHHAKGCLRAYRQGKPRLLSAAEGIFARHWRWQQIRKKLF